MNGRSLLTEAKEMQTDKIMWTYAPAAVSLIVLCFVRLYENKTIYMWNQSIHSSTFVSFALNIIRDRVRWANVT